MMELRFALMINIKKTSILIEIAEERIDIFINDEHS